MTPTAIKQTKSGPVVEWRDLGNFDLDQPFFNGTVQLAHRLSNEPMHPFRAAKPMRTGLDGLAEAAAEQDGLPLAGLIFHMTHCGSTLINRALGSLPQVLALGEPEPVSDLVMLAGAMSERASISSLQDLVGVIGRARRPTQRFLLIKSWSPLSCHIPLFRAAFPSVPWVFVHRDPVEVLVSLLESGGGLPALQNDPLRAVRLLGFDGDHLTDMAPLEFAARVLGKICDGAASAKDDACLAVDYRQLPDAILHQIPLHFGIELDAEMQTRVANATKQDAKVPNREFRSDSAAKRERASREVHDAAARWISPALERVRALPQA